MRPHRRQPTRLPRPWDSPGKKLSGLPFPSPIMKVKSESEVTQSYSTLKRPHGLQPTRLLHPWDIPGKSTGVGCHHLLRNFTLRDVQNQLYLPRLSSGEGNGNPLQCSCLENPRDGGAWWAAISGVAQSCTLLKRLSSSISRLLSGYLGVGKSSNAMINYERHEQYKRAVTSHPWSSWL